MPRFCQECEVTPVSRIVERPAKIGRDVYASCSPRNYLPSFRRADLFTPSSNIGHGPVKPKTLDSRDRSSRPMVARSVKPCDGSTLETSFLVASTAPTRSIWLSRYWGRRNLWLLIKSSIPALSSLSNSKQHVAQSLSYVWLTLHLPLNWKVKYAYHGLLRKINCGTLGY